MSCSDSCDRAERREALVLADRRELVAAAGEDLVRVGLVADVPEDLVARRVEQRVQRDGELAGAEVGAEVPADLADRVDDVLADLLGDLGELVLVEARGGPAGGRCGRGGGGRHEVRVRMKSVICSSSGAPCRRRLRERRGAPSRGDSAASSRAPSSPNSRDVRALAVALVAALRLAERVVGPGHVEDVVDDLEEHAELGGEAAVRRLWRSSHAGSAAVRSRPTRRSAARS